MNYNSTRNSAKAYPSSYCIVKGLADDGGLFVPSEQNLPKYDLSLIDNSKSYNEIAADIFSLFFTDFSKQQINAAVQNAYNKSNFDDEDIIKVKSFDDISVLELTHGRTCAFKDIALSVLPHLMNSAKFNLNDASKTLILAATSGDTGKAALEGFSDVDDTGVIVFYPYKGVSDIQLKQMLTQKGANVSAVAVKGNFDDVQSSVKNIFASKAFNERLAGKNISASSANSINIGRLIPQIAYYFASYKNLTERGVIKDGDYINFCVPSGNFGNILAGWYAKKLGLKINKLICASNKNNILTDFFSSGVYKTSGREFYKTMSPSMDILVSSNLERLLYEIEQRDDLKTGGMMESLKKTGFYSVDKANEAFSSFACGYCAEEDTLKAIKKFYEKYAYLLDTHTAVGYKVIADYRAYTQDTTHTVLISTASPYKFASDVYFALSGVKSEDTLSNIDSLFKLTSSPLPKPIEELFTLKSKQETVVDANGMEYIITEIIDGGLFGCLQ